MTAVIQGTHLQMHRNFFAHLDLLDFVTLDVTVFTVNLQSLFDLLVRQVFIKTCLSNLIEDRLRCSRGIQANLPEDFFDIHNREYLAFG